MAQHVVFYRTQPEKGHAHRLQAQGILRASAEFSSGCYEAMGFFVPGQSNASSKAAAMAPAKRAKKASQ